MKKGTKLITLLLSACLTLGMITPINAAPKWNPTAPEGSVLISKADDRTYGYNYGAASYFNQNNNNWQKAFDGKIATYYDTAEELSTKPEGNVGVSLNRAFHLTQIDIFPRADGWTRLGGMQVQGTVDGDEWVTLYEFPSDEDYSVKQYTVKASQFKSDYRDYKFRQFRVCNLKDHFNVAEVALFGDTVGNEYTPKKVPLTEVPEGYIGIYTAKDLDNIRNITRDGGPVVEGNFILMNDIDISEYKNWKPINTFAGKFNGNWHKITGLTITQCDGWAAGLFGNILSSDSIVEKLTLENVNINIDLNTSKELYNIGSLAGFTKGKISYCSASGKINVINNNPETKNAVEVGCLVGAYSMNYPSSMQFNNIVSNVDVTCTKTNVDNEHYYIVGGVIGYVGTWASDDYMDNITNNGTVKFINNAGWGSYVGGISGFVSVPDGKLYINNCVNNGDVSITTNEKYAHYYVCGGILGRAELYNEDYGDIKYNSESVVEITNTHNKGKVESAYMAGGIIGDIRGYGNIENIIDKVNVIKCSNTGAVTSSSKIAEETFAGGIFGASKFGYEEHYKKNTLSVTDCYNSGIITATIPAGCGAYTSLDTTVTNFYNRGEFAGYYGIAVCELKPDQKVTATNCYGLNCGQKFCMEGKPTVTGSGLLSVESMKKQASFVGFDFNKVWQMGTAEYPHPVLRK